MNYLLDTNVISELVAKRPNTQVVRWVDSLDPQHVYLSVITIGEIRKGVEKLPPSKRRDDILAWLKTDLQPRFAGRIVDLTIAVMLTWGELAGRLERQGQTMPVMDSLLAATALTHGLGLVTRNESDFQHTGVQLFNPWKENLTP